MFDLKFSVIEQILDIIYRKLYSCEKNNFFNEKYWLCFQKKNRINVNLNRTKNVVCSI